MSRRFYDSAGYGYLAHVRHFFSCSKYARLGLRAVNRWRRAEEALFKVD